MNIEIKDNGKWQNSFTLKIVFLAIMGLLLLIPLELIKEMIRERQKNSEEIKKEIAFQWAGPQTISGPVLNVPVLIRPENKDAEPVRVTFHILPEETHTEGKVSTEKRHRSIYEAIVYTSDIKIRGQFLVPQIKGETGIMLWNEAYFSMGVSDNRGIKGNVRLHAGDSVASAIPGLRETALFASGITFPFPMDGSEQGFPFSVDLKISGSESIFFTPLGKTTNVQLSSGWNSPGFSGNFLPSERSITKSGFDAKWIVTDLNRNFPQQWTGSSYHPETDSFGTEFVLQADHYQKSLRSAKYGILFIALTFLALIFMELTIHEKINVFHYLLVAFGLVLFFSLLNAISEQAGFNIAYLAGSVSTILLLCTFLKSVLRKKRPVLMFGGMLVFLYSFIYVLLTLKDYAYLAGNIGLFLLLAVTMRLSLKLRDIKD